MRILVTGGAGFIGSHVVDAYLEAGHEVAVLDNLVTGKLENLRQALVRFFAVDITDREAVFEAVQDFRPEVVSHHAAQMSVKASTENPHYDAEANVVGLINVLDAAVSVGTRKIVFAGSGGTIYGEPPVLPTPERAPLAPICPYGITKMAGEHYLRYYQAAHGLDFTAFRYGNVYGPRQDPHGEAGVIAIFARRLLANAAPMITWDGEQRRDYVHVLDVAKANVLALDAGSGEAFNIGSGAATSVNELFAVLEGYIRTGLRPTYVPRREGDARFSYLDIAKADVELGWRPELSLEEGLIDTIAFFRNQVANEGVIPAGRER